MSKSVRDKISARQEREAMRSGVILRAQTFTNRKRKASREACRKGKWS